MKKDWEIKKLGEICTIQLGKTPYRQNPKFWDKEKISGNVWLSISDLKHGEYISKSAEQISDLGAKDVVKIPQGTILLSFKLTLGRVSFAGCDLFTNEAIASLLNLRSEISKEFLFYYFSFFDWDKVTEGDIKVKGKTLNKKKLNDLEILIPPLPEQRRIVSVLDKCFTAIDKAKTNAEQNLKNAKELFESYLQGVFENGKDWEVRKLKDIALVFGRGKSKHRPRNWEGLFGGKYPFIQTGEVRNANKFVSEYIQTYNEVGLAQSKLWAKGTICITIAANIAETAILGFDACIPDSIIGLQVNPKKADLDFTYYLLQYFKAELQKLGKGSAQDNINLGTFENQFFPFPPLQTQQTIVHQLDALKSETQKLETVYKKNLSDLAELKKSILHEVFSGKMSESGFTGLEDLQD